MFQRVAFLFAGQGAQTVGMGQDLAAADPGARAVFASADAALGRAISEICFTGPLETLTASSNCQPAITVTSLACLAAFLARRPLAPVACAGLSLGEYAALVAAGAMDADTAVRLVAERGRLMDAACRASAGTMAAVLNGDPDLVAKICAGAGIDVANFNCPGQLVISGTRDGVAQAIDALKAAGVSRVIPLTVDGAFHSRLMAPAATAFGAVLAAAAIHAPACPVAQNVTGALVTDAAAIRANLAAQITGSVRWESCVRTILALGADAVIEFGPGQVLAGFMKRIDKTVPVFNIGSQADLDKLLADPRWA